MNVFVNKVILIVKLNRLVKNVTLPVLNVMEVIIKIARDVTKVRWGDLIKINAYVLMDIMEMFRFNVRVYISIIIECYYLCLTCLEFDIC